MFLLYRNTILMSSDDNTKVNKKTAKNYFELNNNSFGNEVTNGITIFRVSHHFKKTKYDLFVMNTQ